MTQYVMVPVPEEHAEEVQHLIIALGLRIEAAKWNADAIAELCSSVTPALRETLSAIAVGSVHGRGITAKEVAEAQGATEEAILTQVDELNEACRSRSRQVLIFLDSFPESFPEKRNLLAIDRRTAGLIQPEA